LRLFNRDVRLFLIAVALLRFATFGGIYTVLFNLYLLRLGYGPEFVGLVNAVGMLASAIFSMPAGALGRRWSPRRVMIVGLSLVAVGYGLLPMAEFALPAWREGWIIATYFVAWLGATLYLVNSHPFLMAITGAEERNHAFSIRAALRLVAFAGSLVAGLLPGFLGARLGVSLDDPAPYRYPLLIAAVMLIPAVLVLLATSEVSSAPTYRRLSGAGPAPYGLIALLALVGLFRQAGSSAAMTFFNVYLDAGLHVPTVQIGTLSAASNLVAVPAALATPLLMERWGNGRTYLSASLATALSLLPLALIPHWGAAGLGYIGMIALGSITFPAFSIYEMEIVSPDWRPTMSGAISMATGIGRSVIALTGGYIIATVGYRSFFLTAIVLTTVGALLFGACFRVPRGELARGEIAGQ